MNEAAIREAEDTRQIRNLVHDALGAEVTDIEFMPAGLGTRRFARVSMTGGPAPTAIARIDAPEDPSGRPEGIPAEPPLEPLRALLERHSLPVPARYASSRHSSIELLEDAGPFSLSSFAPRASIAERGAIYREACDLIVRLQHITDDGSGVDAFRRRLDLAYFRYKANLFTTWSVPERGSEATAAEAACVREAFAAIATEVASAPARLAHRDFQSTNIHLPPGRAAPHRLMMIDLQGALLAPPEYDLVCLLRDSYVELREAEITQQLERVRPRLPDAPEQDEFMHRFDLLTLSRKAKDHARFVYAAKHRGEIRLRDHLPVTVRHLRGAAMRVAMRESRFSALAELIHTLPEPTCAG